MIANICIDKMAEGMNSYFIILRSSKHFKVSLGSIYRVEGQGMTKIYASI